MSLQATILFEGADQYLQLNGLANGLDKSPVNNATVSASIFRVDDIPVAGAQNITMVSVDARGTYRGLLTSDFDPVEDNESRSYYVIVTATAGGLTTGPIRINVQVQQRTLL